MLTQLQSREFNRCQRLQVFFDKNGAIISTFIPFEEEVTSFNTNFTQFKDNIANKGMLGTGITVAQNDLKTKIAIALATICAITRAYTSKYNNPKLAAEVCYTKSEILKLKEGDVLGTVTRVNKVLTPLLSDAGFMKYKITAATLTALVDDAIAFNDNIGKAGLIDSEKSIANKNINAAIKLLHGNVKQFDRLINTFAGTNPDFINGYKINSVLDNTGIHHSGIEGIITNAATGQPIKNARIETTDGDKMTNSDMIGFYELIKLRVGNNEVNFSADGYNSKTVSLHVGRGKISKVNVTL